MLDSSRLPERALVLPVLTLLGACVSAQFVPTGAAYPARPPTCTIEVFSAGPPDRSFEEIGMIEAEGSRWKASLEDLLPRLKEEACLAGGDALVLQSAQRYEAREYHGDDEARMFALVTVIRWTGGG